ncbi:MAG TPA: hypothetical protein VE713_03380 [Pyrinomonadaceae bacterium]|jgi:hypothetical protein|nr:hypothetical protein [Pyrinomonadaceae bacterium]
MGDLIYIVVRVLLVILVGAIPVWLATRRSRAEFRRRFGRTPSNAELDDLGAWLKDPVDKYAAQPQQQQTATPPQQQLQQQPQQSLTQTEPRR